MATTQQPAFQAYTVVKREGQDDFWIGIGAAFPHQDGNGYNIVLQALPIDGKVVLRPPKSQDDASLQKNARRDDNRERRRDK